jgi:hypothetical protein
MFGKFGIETDSYLLNYLGISETEVKNKIMG